MKKKPWRLTLNQPKQWFDGNSPGMRGLRRAVPQTSASRGCPVWRSVNGLFVSRCQTVCFLWRVNHECLSCPVCEVVWGRSELIGWWSGIVSALAGNGVFDPLLDVSTNGCTEAELALFEWGFFSGVWYHCLTFFNWSYVKHFTLYFYAIMEACFAAE